MHSFLLSVGHGETVKELGYDIPPEFLDQLRKASGRENWKDVWIKDNDKHFKRYPAIL